MDSPPPCRTVWEESIRLAWTIMSQFRHPFKLDIHPYISTAFVMLHHYFRANRHSQHPLYIVITCCCLASLKSFEVVQPLQTIFNALLKTCRELSQRASPASLKQILNLSEFSDRDLTNEESMAMNLCELDVLEAHNFESHLPVSFEYTELFVYPSLQAMEPEIGKKFQDDLQLGQCFALLSVHYLEYVPEAIAVAVTERVFAEYGIPEAVAVWIGEAIERIGLEAVVNARELMAQQQKVLGNRQRASATITTRHN
jgi:hypothetical protein